MDASLAANLGIFLDDECHERNPAQYPFPGLHFSPALQLTPGHPSHSHHHCRLLLLLSPDDVSCSGILLKKQHTRLFFFYTTWNETDLASLHWLPDRFRIDFKILLFVFKGFLMAWHLHIYVRLSTFSFQQKFWGCRLRCFSTLQEPNSSRGDQVFSDHRNIQEIAKTLLFLTGFMDILTPHTIV